MGVEEVGTLQTLKAHRREAIDPTNASHGDGMLVEFASAGRCRNLRDVRSQLARPHPEQ
jgi:hypothetical protein